MSVSEVILLVKEEMRAEIRRFMVEKSRPGDELRHSGRIDAEDTKGLVVHF